jgi:hypothetical protein
VASTQDLLQAEYDADERQDEILFKGGIYPLPFRRGLLWKILVVVGAVILFFGLLFWAQIGGLRFPNLSFIPAVLMPLMSIFLALLGLVCLLAGVVLGLLYRRDPYEMQPIR